MGNKDIIPLIPEALDIQLRVQRRKWWQKYSAIALLVIAAFMAPNYAFWGEVSERTLRILEERFGTPLSVFIAVALFTWFTKRLHGAFYKGEPMPRLGEALHQVWEWAKTSVVTLLMFAVLFGLVAVFYVIPKMHKEAKKLALIDDGRMAVPITIENLKTNTLHLNPIAICELSEHWLGGTRNWNEGPIRISPAIPSANAYNLFPGERKSYLLLATESLREPWQRGAGMLTIRISDIAGQIEIIEAQFNKDDLPLTNIICKFR